MEFIPLPSAAAAAAFFLFSFLFTSSFHFHTLRAQQTYLNNKQLACENNLTQTLGYVCNGVNTSCASYLTFRSEGPLYDSAVLIAYLLGADSKTIASINKITDVEKIPNNELVMVPVTCSCLGDFYQHNASYTLKIQGETYFTVSNNTYQGLTTCQAMMNQNPYDYRNLFAGMSLSVPLRCACPTQAQVSNGYKYLLTYLPDWKDDVSQMAERFKVDEQTLLDANKKSVDDDVIFPFTPFLIPLKTEPTTAFTVTPSPPPVEPPPPSVAVVPAADEKGSNRRKWVYVGVGIGAGFCVLVLAAVFLCWFRHRRHKKQAGAKPGKPTPERGRLQESFIGIGGLSGMRSSESFLSQGLRQAVGSLTEYKFEELQNATNSFSDDVIIKGSVYHGVINGDNAAIKKMKGDVTNEIKILNQVRHSNLIRLSGFCLHQGDTYLVYEFAENGSLSDWLHEKKYRTSASTLSWKQRVQIAYDVAGGLNYLHNYANPSYIHKDLKTSNILLDSNFRAKVANFGLARSVENEEGGLQMTRHVVGTQGYMAPEYLEHGLITPKLDVFAFGVLLLELLSGREALANTADEEKNGGLLLSASIMPILKGEDVRGKLKAFIDPCLRHEYPFDLAFSMAQLAMSCVENDLNSRPKMDEVFMSLSKILSSSLDWDPSSDNPSSGSFAAGR